MTAIPLDPTAFSPGWLENALGAPPGTLDGFDHEPIGTGQVANSHRITLDWVARPAGAPESLVAKCPSPTMAAVRMMNLYEREVRWYRELAGTSTVRVPVCHHAEIDADGDRFALLLEDCAPGRPGDQLAGADLPAIRAALDEAARLHAPFVGQPPPDWLRFDAELAALRSGVLGQFWPTFRDRYRGRLAPEVLELGDAYVARVTASEEPEPELTTFVHGDFRIDNMLFGLPEGRAVILDWQTVRPGHPLSDVAYLIGTSIADPSVRKAEETGLVEGYCRRMGELGVSLDPGTAWNAYRFHAAGGFVMAITASLVAKRTDRGDEMFAVMAERPARQMMDLDTLSLLG